MKWKIVYFEDDDKKSEVYDFIESLNEKQQAKILAWLTLLSERGPNLPRPYADILEDGIHELRIKITGDQIRILYFFCYKDFIILTNKFLKNTNKVPLHEIKKAKIIRDQFLKKYTEKKLQEEYNENTQ